MRSQRIRRLGIGILVVVVLASWTVTPWAQMFVPTGRDTLRGLPGVEVVVEKLPPELEPRHLTTANLRADVEQRLRAAGIAVYASQKANPTGAQPYLYVHLNPLELPGGLLAVAIQVHLRQTVRSTVTSSHIVNAMTWESHTLVAVAPPEFGQVRETILEMVDGFVADWRAVH